MLTDQQITDALLAGGGLLTEAARHLTEQLGRPVSRSIVAGRVESSRVLRAVQQIAEERGWAGAIEIARKAKKQWRKARNKELWAERAHLLEDVRGDRWQAAKLAHEAAVFLELVPEPIPTTVPEPVIREAAPCERDGRANMRACARATSGVTAATVQAARDRRLCCAKTRKGVPCIRRVVPGMDRCPSHGGKSTGPRTAAGKARISAAQRARWERYRQERRT
jgi:hypothetical protein